METFSWEGYFKIIKMKIEDLKLQIRDVYDFPKKGIVFKDITPLLEDKNLFKFIIDCMTEYYKNKKIDKIVSIESRGFILGSALSYNLGAGFVPVRKKGKLPYKTISYIYELEYGTDELFMHEDAIYPDENVLIIDDVLATGGTMNATINIVKSLNANIVGICFLIELLFLKGMEKIKDYDVFSIIKLPS